MNATMMNRIEEFTKRYSIEEEGKEEMLKILNESLSMISMEILKTVKVKKENVKENEKKRYKSKKAEEYAEEHNIEIEEFSMNEISKKDVENLIREKTKLENSIENKKEKKSVEKKKVETKKERVICSGINKRGEACKSTGTINPEGAKKKYCFRHAEDWKSFECASDSSENEEEELKEEELCKEISIVDEDED